MKKILSLSILLLLTGCSVSYNLIVEEDTFYETIKGRVLNSETKPTENQTDVNYMNYYLSTNQTVLINSNDIFYKKTLSKNNDSTDFIYAYAYTKDTINNSRVLNECFENFKFTEENNLYHLTAFGDFYCDYADETEINIKTDYEVIYHNAESEKNGTYTWTIKKDNTKDLELYITISKQAKSNNNQTTWSIIKTALACVLLALSAICIFILKKKEKQFYM